MVIGVKKPIDDMEKVGRKRDVYEDACDTDSYDSDSDSASDVEKARCARREPSARFQRRHAPSAYSSSSRETSGSHQHLLHTSPNKRKSSFYFYKIPPRVVRYMNWALLSTMIIIAICLIRASYTSSRQVEMGTVEKSAPKPPPWEAFPFLKRYHGGIRTLISKKANTPEYPHDQQQALKNTTVSKLETKPLPKSIAFDPYTEAGEGFAEKHECFLDIEDTIKIPRVHYYPGVVESFPDAVMGSPDVLGLRNDICFERFGRLGPYGYGYSVKRGGTGAGLHGDREGAEDLWTGPGSSTEIDYSKIQWVKVQSACTTKNAGRFAPVEKTGGNLFLNLHPNEGQASRDNG
ncbi:MAG: hypothetical protein Q9224_007331, partial [Gallowayella concinna]